MKLKKLLTVALSSAILVSLVGCSNVKEDNKIIVGVSPNPHAEILEVIKPQLEKEGYELEIKVFDDYVLPNTALNEGSLDANYFQHIPYLEETVKEKGYKITYTEKIHLEPIGLYSDKVKSIDEIKENSVIAIPNDPTNGARALKLLAENGLIKVNDGELIGIKDIIENPKNIEIKEMNAEQLPTILKDVDGAVINTNYALSANLNPTKDAIVIESKDSPYANVLAVREENKESEKIKALSKALTSKEVKEFIEKEYKGSIIPSF
ncbi:MetQ/NlpA family ABC transporter substrate-binding protein [Romboutsia sp.]|uniref:MetQ/NlpA family ABC transporter substrate-binding protein n=1 Tax=Romboutsia sp. TaxID=1965302 RepID=UPI002CD79986|nr:MetQ/NlpA family ABC transporter substrate-binding protein [Romboutsia sp.]HSQ89750.1 MetQ/NlpA family ABC transporter substrate-binding protein [Romboutsia sp.]